MAAKKTQSKAAAKNTAQHDRRIRKERKFPALTLEEALALPQAIQKYAAGQRVRRLTLFEKLDQSPDGRFAKKLITASGQYGLTKGSYTAEYLELTTQGKEATGEDTASSKTLEARFNLAIKNQAPFLFLYEKLKGSKMPATEVLADYLTDANIEDGEKSECIDTFTLNAKFLGLLRTIAGSERIVPIEQAIDEAAAAVTSPHSSPPPNLESNFHSGSSLAPDVSTANYDFHKICFYVTPIGDEDSEERRHSDFLMEYIIKPAVKEFDLEVVRADQMGKPGMIGKQIIEHILHAKLVVADLSFHNPNVFYELSLRHATRRPTVQVKRTVDKLPFDLNQYTTISIETRDPYTLVPKLQTYTAEIATQVRRALDDSSSGDNPISLFCPSVKLTWGDK